MAAVSESFISVSPEMEGFVVSMVMLADLPDGTDSALAAHFGAVVGMGSTGIGVLITVHMRSATVSHQGQWEYSNLSPLWWNIALSWRGEWPFQAPVL